MFKQEKRMSGKQVFAAAIAVLLLLMTLAGCVEDADERAGGITAAASNSQSAVVRWEYDVIFIRAEVRPPGATSIATGRGDSQPITDILNERAEEGWELVTYALYSHTDHVLTLRRRLP